MLFDGEFIPTGIYLLAEFTRQFYEMLEIVIPQTLIQCVFQAAFHKNIAYLLLFGGSLFPENDGEN